MWKARALQAEASKKGLNDEIASLRRQLEEANNTIRNGLTMWHQLDAKNKELEKQIANGQKGQETAATLAPFVFSMSLGSK